MDDINTEYHPLQPFLPEGAELLFLGSFPPQKKRWSMDFYYPNLQNDFWRIMGLLFFQNKEYFVDPSPKRFNKEKIIDFLKEKHIALYDTATAIKRLQDNASDKYLEVVQQTNIFELLEQMPKCRCIVATGQKAMDNLILQLNVQEPTVGNSTPFIIKDKTFLLYRMPSSSRAYPLPLERKADVYKKMFTETAFVL